ncbi:MAG: type I-C CRISPR-associated protein Cas5c [Sumerlaeia bacterium]
MPHHQTHILRVWGDLACFSRPELKVERFSYPCPTPSAARGVFDAIYLKPPEFRWQIEAIELLRPPAFIALRRNEVKDVANAAAVAKWMAGSAEPEPIWADADKDFTGSDERGRTQRQTMALRDVAYRFHARIVPHPGHESKQRAFDDQFARRARAGKCFQQPYFGCREFPAFFELEEDAASSSPPAPVSEDLGWMIYDTFALGRPGSPDSAPSVSVFRARIENGRLEVPPWDSDAVRKAPGGV